MKRHQQTPRRPRTIGLKNDAATLGVHRTHLYLVLSGRRQSLSLLSRYQDLKAKQAAQADAPQSAPKARRGAKTPPPALRSLQEPLQALQEANLSEGHTSASAQP